MNIRDIARLADVTPGTVSKVLNNYPDISEATRQHVLKIIEENQYDPKANTRSSKASADSNRVGLVIEGVYNGLYSQMFHMLSIRIHNAGYSIVSFHDNYYVQDKQEKFSELKEQAEQDKLCALIYIGGNFQSVSAEEFSAFPCPIIFVNTALPVQTGRTPYSSIQVSHFETGYAQMRRLIEKGHRDICTVISSEVDNSVYANRVNGYRAALCQAKLEHNLSSFLQGHYRSDILYPLLLAHLRQNPQITAICCVADIMIPGVLRAIHDAGKAVGKDVDVISFDGLESMEFSVPSVTTFAQPVQDMVNYIDGLLFGLIGKERSHQAITFQPVFQQRESC